MQKRESTYNPSLLRYNIVAYTLAAGATQQIDCSGAFVLSHFKSADQGGAVTGIQLRVGDTGDEFHTIVGDLFKSGIGFDKIFLRNDKGVSISGAFMISHDPDFMFFNFFNSIVR